MKKNFLFFALLLFCFYSVSFAEEASDIAILDSAGIDEIAIDTPPSPLGREGAGGDGGDSAEIIAETKTDDETEISQTEETDETDAPETNDTLTALVVITNPDSATILLNRRIAGITPFVNNEIEPRNYNIMLLKDGFELFDTTVNLAVGQKDTLVINLIPEGTAAANVVSAATNVPTQTAQTANGAQAIDPDSPSDEAQTSQEEDKTPSKKRRMDRIGIIAFLSVMLISMGMQEARSR